MFMRLKTQEGNYYLLFCRRFSRCASTSGNGLPAIFPVEIFQQSEIRGASPVQGLTWCIK
jgi:hypothetical protein